MTMRKLHDDVLGCVLCYLNSNNSEETEDPKHSLSIPRMQLTEQSEHMIAVKSCFTTLSARVKESGLVHKDLLRD